MGRWTIVNGLLVVIVALLGFQIVRTWGRGLPPVQVPAASAPAPAPEPREREKGKHADKAAARVQQTPDALVAAIADKDLFDPSRRPPAPEEVKAEAVVPVTKPPDGVTVVGVRIFGKDREVFVTDATQNPAVGRRLRSGDQIAGYTVKTIDAAAVTFASPSGDSVSLPLTVDKGKQGPTPQRSPVPVRPGQPAAQPASPALGPQGASPAAGVVPKPATPPPPVVPQPAVPPNVPQVQQLPPQVRQKLEQLKQNDKRSGRRH